MNRFQVANCVKNGLIKTSMLDRGLITEDMLTPSDRCDVYISLIGIKGIPDTRDAMLQGIRAYVKEQHELDPELNDQDIMGEYFAEKKFKPLLRKLMIKEEEVWGIVKEEGVPCVMREQ